MKQRFRSIRFQPASLGRIAQANGILAEYEAMGLRLTVRQLFYQMVSRGLVDNTQRQYKNLVALMTKARDAGLVSWKMIEDRSRQVIYPPHWETPTEFLEAVVPVYRLDRWAEQGCHVEVMLEKDALAGVLAETCNDLDVRLIPNRGYASASAMHTYGQRLYWRARNGKEVHVFYLGDHDPSGLDMDRDIVERLGLYSHDTPLQFRRLALTMEQIEEYGPPPNPAKVTDSRAPRYIREHGYESWELDALEPAALRELVEGGVTELRDSEAYAETTKAEKEGATALQGVIDEWKARE